MAVLWNLWWFFRKKYISPFRRIHDYDRIRFRKSSKQANFKLKTRQLLPQLNLGKYKSTSLPSPGFIVLPKVSSLRHVVILLASQHKILERGFRRKRLIRQMNSSKKKFLFCARYIGAKQLILDITLLIGSRQRPNSVINNNVTCRKCD